MEYTRGASLGMVIPQKSETLWLSKNELEKGMEFIHNNWKKNHILSTNKKLFNWIYNRKDDRDVLSVLVTKKNGKINGFLGVINHDFCIKGAYYKSAWLAIWVLENKQPSSEGLMLLKNLFKNNYDIIGTQGFSKIAENIYNGLHFEICNALPRMVKVFDSKSVEILIKEKKIKGPIQKFDFKKNNCSKVSILTRFWDSSTDKLLWQETWSKLIAPSFIGVARDYNFINWRYLKHPLTNYSLIMAVENKKISGFVAFHIQKIQNHKHKVLRIIDLVSITNDATRELLNAIDEFAKINQVIFADFTSINKNLTEIFSQSGYLQTKKDCHELPNLFFPLEYDEKNINLTIWKTKQIKEKIPQFLHEQDLYFTISEVDQDRPN